METISIKIEIAHQTPISQGKSIIARLHSEDQLIESMNVYPLQRQQNNSI